jgi:hypothetical protein
MWNPVFDDQTFLDAMSGARSGVTVTFVADDAGPSALLADMINPAGPIGFYGNYAIYYLRSEFASPLIFEMMQMYKAPYAFTDPETGETILMDPRQAELSRIYTPAAVTDEIVNAKQDDMLRYVPTLRLAYRVARTKGEAAVTALLADLTTFKSYYAEYLFRKERSRQLVVDTNNVLIDLLPCEGSGLEPFKQVHRAVDATKVLAEVRGIELENVRKAERIAHNDYEDPDTERERVVVVRGNGDLVAAETSRSFP